MDSDIVRFFDNMAIVSLYDITLMMLILVNIILKILFMSELWLGVTDSKKQKINACNMSS